MQYSTTVWAQTDLSQNFPSPVRECTSSTCALYTRRMCALGCHAPCPACPHLPRSVQLVQRRVQSRCDQQVSATTSQRAILLNWHKMCVWGWCIGEWEEGRGVQWLQFFWGVGGGSVRVPAALLVDRLRHTAHQAKWPIYEKSSPFPVLHKRQNTGALENLHPVHCFQKVTVFRTKAEICIWVKQYFDKFYIVIVTPRVNAMLKNNHKKPVPLRLFAFVAQEKNEEWFDRILNNPPNHLKLDSFPGPKFIKTHDHVTPYINNSFCLPLELPRNVAVNVQIKKQPWF